MRKIAFLSVGVGCSLFFLMTALYLISTRNADRNQDYLAHVEEQQHIMEAEELIASGLTDEAIEIIQHYKSQIENDTPTAAQWTELFINTCLTKGDVEQLTILFEYNPDAFIEHEDAALLVAQYYLNHHQYQAYQVLRSYWQGFENQDDKWFFLDADLLVMTGQHEKAIRFLNSHTFTGEIDVGRLLRLAELSKDSHPKEAWNYLTKAKKKDPRNATVRLYCANILESLGNHHDALAEYHELAALDSNNTSIQEQIALFHLRQNNYDDALHHWSKNLNENSSDETWLNFLFWNKVAKPHHVKMTEQLIPNSTMDSYIRYLAALKPGEYWNQEAFTALPNAKEIQATQQSAYWLKLVSALKNNRTRDAWKMLKTNQFYSTSWNPELEKNLRYLLMYRGLGTGETIDGAESLALLNLEHRGDFSSILSCLAYHAQPGYPAIETSDNLDAFLHSPAAIAAIFLQAGWNETALQIFPMHTPPTHTPEWVSVDLISTLAKNRTVTKAIEYASTLEPTQHLPEVVMDLYEQVQASEKEKFTLKQLNQQNNETAFCVANLLTHVLIDHEELSDAKKMIYSQKQLFESTEGQEMLARICIYQDDHEQAARIYATIENNSLEAKSYLASKAFSEKNWTKARQLTYELLQAFPNNLVLQENMKAIVAEEQE